VSQHRIYLFPAQHHGDIELSFCPANPIGLPEFLFKDMPEEEQQDIERLVLRGRGHPAFHRQKRQEFFYVIPA
jgi:hypothetical protein